MIRVKLDLLKDYLKDRGNEPLIELRVSWLNELVKDIEKDEDRFKFCSDRQVIQSLRTLSDEFEQLATDCHVVADALNVIGDLQQKGSIADEYLKSAKKRLERFKDD